MNDLLNSRDKKYLPIETSIGGFSHFKGTDNALYISDNVLYVLNLRTGESIEVEDFYEVSNVKCVSSDTFVLNSDDCVYVASFNNGKITVRNEYPMDSTASKAIDASGDLSIIVLSAYENLIVIADGNLVSHDMVDIQYSLALSDDGKYIASGSSGGIKILDAGTLEVVKEFMTEAIPISMSFSPDGKTLLYGDDYKNIVSLKLDTGESVSYENPFYSKPVYIGWLNDSDRFIVSFLSECVGIYTSGNDAAETIRLEEFRSRYFQYASLIDKDIIAICVENLRTDSVVESVPVSDIVVLQKIS